MRRSNEEEIKPGDQVIFPSRYATRHGPFRVRKIDDLGVWLRERNRPFRRAQLVKLKPGQTVRQALTAVVPASDRCVICGFRPGLESHFITVPLPKAFILVCKHCKAEAKEEIRKRVKDIVSEIFEEAMKKASKEACYSEA